MEPVDIIKLIGSYLSVFELVLLVVAVTLIDKSLTHPELSERPV